MGVAWRLIGSKWIMSENEQDGLFGWTNRYIGARHSRNVNRDEDK